FGMDEDDLEMDLPILPRMESGPSPECPFCGEPMKLMDAEGSVMEQSQQYQSTFRVSSRENQSFGTAFCIDKNTQGSFFLTCAHVVEECGEESLLIKGKEVKVLHKGVAELVDLALLYVEGLLESRPLVLTESSTLKEKHTPFEVTGFKVHREGSYKQETLVGTIKKTSKVSHENQMLQVYEFQISEGDAIEKGYSGSAIIASRTQQVIAVVTDRNRNAIEAYAVPIHHLKSIWQDAPQRLFVEEPIIEPDAGSSKPVIKKKRFPFLVPFAIILALLTFLVTKVVYPDLELGDIVLVLILISFLLAKAFVYIRTKFFTRSQ
nr:serine protease [Campylobacterota bacterium]